MGSNPIGGTCYDARILLQQWGYGSVGYVIDQASQRQNAKRHSKLGLIVFNGSARCSPKAKVGVRILMGLFRELSLVSDAEVVEHETR